MLEGGTSVKVVDHLKACQTTIKLNFTHNERRHANNAHATERCVVSENLK
jgi:hypothetical protein